MWALQPLSFFHIYCYSCTSCQFLLISHIFAPNTLSSTLHPFISFKVHQIPLVSIWDSLVIHHSDIRQPLCGHALFFKEYSPSSLDILYREGTTDMREVRLRSLRKLCGQLIIRHFLFDLAHSTLSALIREDWHYPSYCLFQSIFVDHRPQSVSFASIGCLEGYPVKFV